MSDPGRKPLVPYWHLWVDTNGVSHQRQCHLTNYYLRGVGPADPQWNNKQGRYPSTVIFTVQPVGWFGDWHENPAPQWIVVGWSRTTLREHGSFGQRIETHWSATPMVTSTSLVGRRPAPMFKIFDGVHGLECVRPLLIAYECGQCASPLGSRR